MRALKIVCRFRQFVVFQILAVIVGCSMVPDQSARFVTPPEATMPPVQIGVSFSPVRAIKLGLNPDDSFSQVLGMHFAIVRLSDYWDQDEIDGFDQLDREMNLARDAHQPVMLSVGIKSMGWPEFFVPKYLQPLPPDGKSIDSSQVIADAGIAHLREVVNRYKGYQNLVAWQVENEPLDQTGPHRWSISLPFLSQEVGVVKGADIRPVSVNAFSHHFVSLTDILINQGREQDSLQVLRRGDILGLDVYKTPDSQIFGYKFGAALPNWADRVGSWRPVAAKQGKSAWVSEVQAEPWNMVPFKPTETVDEIKQLTDHGFDHILLWGVEYWLAQDAAGHSQWLDTIRAIQTYVNQPKLFVAKANAAATS